MLGICMELANYLAWTEVDALLVFCQHLLIHTHTEVDLVSCIISTLYVTFLFLPIK